MRSPFFDRGDGLIAAFFVFSMALLALGVI